MKKRYKVLHLCCGIGGGALGFQNATMEWKTGLIGTEMQGSFETLAGIDVDPAGLKDFERLTGARGILMDLFSRQQFIDFHGKEPDVDWSEVHPQDLLDALYGEHPDVIFISAPCKGYSLLLPNAKAETKKYQALNALAERAVFLALEAFKDNLPAFFCFENVPGINGKRGKKHLANIKALFRSYGYEISRSNYHDCGEIGGLGQHRKRFLMVARNPKKTTTFLYEPYIQRVKSIGEVLETLPMPNDPKAGPMHRLQKLQWKTWVRLALIPAGGDWRDLEENQGKNGWAGSYRIIPWGEPANCVTASTKGIGQSNGASAVADPRLDTFSNIYKVNDWNEPAAAITGGCAPSNGGGVVADPRLETICGYENKFQVVDWNEAAPTVTGSRIGSGAPFVGDPRLPERKMRYPGLFKVIPWNEPASTVLGQTDIQCGALSVADTRLGCKPRAGTMGVSRWDEPAKTVIGSGDIHAGSAAVADVRIPNDNDRLDPAPVIISMDGTWHRPLTTLELAALQGLPMQFADGTPLVLDGKSDAKWRERIGNMVPVPAAQAIGEQILKCLLASENKEFTLGDTKIWVNPQVNIEKNKHQYVA